jgi:cbb3-type cytochrome oxidase subunit 3
MAGTGVEIYPLISFILFFGIFIIMLVYVFSRDKKYIQEVSNLPLEGDNNDMP